MGIGKKTAYTPLDPDVNQKMESLSREQKKIPYRIMNEALRQHFKMNAKNIILLQLSIREAELAEQAERTKIMAEEAQELLESIRYKKDKAMKK